MDCDRRSEGVLLLSVARRRKAKEEGGWGLICVLQFTVTQDHVQRILAASSSVMSKVSSVMKVM